MYIPGNFDKSILYHHQFHSNVEISKSHYLNFLKNVILLQIFKLDGMSLFHCQI